MYNFPGDICVLLETCRLNANSTFQAAIRKVYPSQAPSLKQSFTLDFQACRAAGGKVSIYEVITISFHQHPLTTSSPSSDI